MQQTDFKSQYLEQFPHAARSDPRGSYGDRAITMQSLDSFQNQFSGHSIDWDQETADGSDFCSAVLTNGKHQSSVDETMDIFTHTADLNAPGFTMSDSPFINYSQQLPAHFAFSSDAPFDFTPMADELAHNLPSEAFPSDMHIEMPNVGMDEAYLQYKHDLLSPLASHSSPSEKSRKGSQSPSYMSITTRTTQRPFIFSPSHLEARPPDVPIFEQPMEFSYASPDKMGLSQRNSMEFMNDPALFEFAAAFDDYSLKQGSISSQASGTKSTAVAQAPPVVTTGRRSPSLDDERDMRPPPQVSFVGGYDIAAYDVPEIIPTENGNGKRALPPLQRPKVAPENDEPLDLDDLTVAQLKIHLKRHNASAVGKKDVLIARLKDLMVR